MRATSLKIIVPLLTCFPILASAQIVTRHVPDDATLSTLLPTPAFVAEGRIGDRAGVATFKLDLGPDTSRPAVTSQHSWQSGVPEDFTLSYDGVGLVTFSLRGHTLEYGFGLTGTATMTWIGDPPGNSHWPSRSRWASPRSSSRCCRRLGTGSRNCFAS